MLIKNLSVRLHSRITQKRNVDIANMRLIDTEQDYKEALQMVSKYFDMEPELNTPESDGFKVLLALIEAYESKHYPIGII